MRLTQRIDRQDEGRALPAALALATAGMALYFVAAQLLCRVRHIPNLLIYAGACLAFAAAFALAWMLLPQNKQASRKAWKWRWLAPLCALALMIGLYIGADCPLNTWAQAIAALPWHSVQSACWLFVALAGAAAISCALYPRWKGRSRRWAEVVYAAYMLLVAGFCAWLCYQPSLTSGYEAYHYEAYLTGIYNVYFGRPLLPHTAGIYGKYGLFLAPVLRLLGGCDQARVTAVAACIGGVAALLFLLAVRNTTRHPLVRLLAPLALVLLYVAFGQVYLQGVPGRLLVPALFICLFSMRHKGRGWRVMLELSGVFALLWSTDGGVVFWVAAAVARAALFLQQKREAGPMRAALHSVLWALLQMACALAAVNLYNLAVGGPVTLKGFFFPIGYPSYDISVPLFGTESIAAYLSPLYAYFWIIAGLMAVAIVSAAALLRRREAAAGVWLALATFGLGLLVYYINRPTYGNLFQCLLPLLALLVMLAAPEQGNTRRAEATRRPLPTARQLLALTLLVVLAGYGALSGATRVRQRLDAQAVVRPGCVAAAEMLRQEISPNTYAFGLFATTLYAQLGWDTRCGYDAIHDALTPNTSERLLADLAKQDEIVMFDERYQEYEAVRAYVAEHFTRVTVHQGDWPADGLRCQWEVLRRKAE